MSLVRNSAFTLASYALPVVVTLATVPLFIRYVGGERYGALAIAWLLLGYFGQADFGIGRALTQRISRHARADPQEVATIVWSAMLIIVAVGIATSAAVYGGAWWYFAGPFKVASGLRAELLASIGLLAACNLLVALNGVTMGALMGSERFVLLAWANLAGSVLMQLLPLAAAIWFDPGMPTLIAASLLARALAFAVVAAALWRDILRGRRRRFSRKHMTGLVGFGKWIMVTSVIGPLMMFADRFVIGNVLGAAAVAAYSIPFQMASRVALLPTALVQVLFPRFATLKDAEAGRHCTDFTVFSALSLAIPVAGLVAMAEPLLRLWLGAALDPRSALVGQILLCGFWINGVAAVPFNYTQARGNPRFTALLHIAELPAYAALLFGLGWLAGLAGLAAAFSVRCAIDCAALILHAGIGTRALVMRVVSPAVLLLALVAAHPLTSDWPVGLIAAILGGAMALTMFLRLAPADMIVKIVARVPSRWHEKVERVILWSNPRSRSTNE